MSVLKLNQIQTANGVIMANLNSSGANIGFQLASTLAPAFSAYLSTDITVSSSTTTKLVFNTENYDTASCFNTSTGIFTPTVAGYYQLTFAGQTDYQSSGRAQTWIYKNGSAIAFREENLNSPASTYPSRFVSALLYANGTSDYFEIYVRHEGGGTKYIYAGNGTGTYFCGFLARSS
jgi:hypothetical protein